MRTYFLHQDKVGLKNIKGFKENVEKHKKKARKASMRRGANNSLINQVTSKDKGKRS